MKKLLLTLLLSIPLFAQQPCDQLLRRAGYTLCYSEQHEQARWVAYTLTLESLLCKGGERYSNFIIDYSIETGSATPMDYFRSGYDRGHLAPAADFKCNSVITFYMSNVSPQDPHFNRGMWKKLERWVRKQAMDNGLARVITGPVLSDSLPKIGLNGVSVPAQFFKIVISGNDTTAFLMPNKWLIGRLENYIVSVDSVETVTGVDF